MCSYNCEFICWGIVMFCCLCLRWFGNDSLGLVCCSVGCVGDGGCSVLWLVVTWIYRVCGVRGLWCVFP